MSPSIPLGCTSFKSLSHGTIDDSGKDRFGGARLPFEVDAMLRHACGYTLANKGHDTRAIQGWLGHRSITNTALAPNRFKDFWRD
jgi:integrase